VEGVSTLQILLGIAVGLPVGGLMLQAAAALCGYEDVAFGRSVVTTFALAASSLLIYLAASYGLDLFGVAKSGTPTERGVLAEVLALPFQTLAGGVLLQPLLGVPFKWGTLVYLLQAFVTFVVVAVLGLTVMGAGLFAELLGWKWV
jgi:hypothetical protein